MIIPKSTLTWKDHQFTDPALLGEKRKTNRIIGLCFPEQDKNLGLEPSILTLLPQGENVEFSLKNNLFNDKDVQLYLCSVYISGMDQFRTWAQQHDRNKIVVGGYHPSTFPEEFLNYAFKIVIGTCDDIWATIAQEGQVVKGINTYKNVPRYDLYHPDYNQQIIPDKFPKERVISINTSVGCPFKCDFCCTPILAPTLQSKPLELVDRETTYLQRYMAKYLFIRDENFPLQKDWRERLTMIGRCADRIYMFASSNLLDEESIKFMAEHKVFMICMGLEDVFVEYGKNKKMAETIALLKKYGIYSYLSFIVNPLKIIGREAGIEYYSKLMETFYALKPEMVCGNFLMPFRGTGLWDQYYAYVGPEDYKFFNSKEPFLVRNPILREKMKFFMFYYQWLYFTSTVYNEQVRKFHVGDTLEMRFLELYEQFKSSYEWSWDKRP